MCRMNLLYRNVEVQEGSPGILKTNRTVLVDNWNHLKLDHCEVTQFPNLPHTTMSAVKFDRGGGA